MDKKPIYFDHAATTPLCKEALEKMLPYFTDVFGNPNSQHAYGRESVKAVDEARDAIAKIINCKPNEVYFTSGGTEGDNWALRGIAHAYKNKGKHLIISPIEHAAMLATAKALKKEGFEIEFMKVDEFGVVDLEHLKTIVRDDTIFVGCMLANNEVGTIEPIKEIAEIAHAKGAVCFTDAVQAAGVLKTDVKELGVDMMSMSAHKIYGPKGVGALYIRNGLKTESILTGGHQERMKRGGTTNVPGIVGFAEAFKIADRDREKNFEYVSSLRDRFIDRVLTEVPFVKLNGPRTGRLPANADFSFKFIEGESILFSLDLAGIAVSSGSACSSGSLEPSHVLLALGLPEELAHGSIRFSFGKHNTVEEVDYAVETIKAAVQRLREMSPLFKAEGEIKYV
ncbi:MAG: cysteine desulfurase [Clostridia bacterium]|nr:cysteine desulfurase [Clostridia bacterium]MBR2449215.1 cysteine desulfurase [Clostridia bacterium]